MVKIADKIRALRKLKKMTQEDLAVKSGKTVNYICRLEGGEFKNPTRDTLQSLAMALEVDISELLTFNYFSPEDARIFNTDSNTAEENEWLSLLEKMTDEQKSALKIMAETFIGKKNTVKKKASNC